MPRCRIARPLLSLSISLGTVRTPASLPQTEITPHRRQQARRQWLNCWPRRSTSRARPRIMPACAQSATCMRASTGRSASKPSGSTSGASAVQDTSSRGIEAKRGSPRLLLIGHLDTVLQDEPFRREGDKGYGSGSADMKGGNLVALEAVRALRQAGVLRDMNITVVYTGDEEEPGEPPLLSREAAARCGAAQATSRWPSKARRPARPSSAAAASAVVAAAGEQANRRTPPAYSARSGYGAIFEAARILERFSQGIARAEPYLQSVGHRRRHECHIRHRRQRAVPHSARRT